MDLANTKQKDNMQNNIDINLQEEDSSVKSQDKSQRKLKIIGIVLSIIVAIVGILISLYFTGIGRNIDDNCNCKVGYYKSGKNCVGPFNEDIFTKEDIHISLKGQDENLAPKIAKRHLEQVYHYTINSRENHQFYSSPSKTVDQTSSHEIRVVTEEVNDEKFRLIVYLGHSNYTDSEGDEQSIEGYPLTAITKSDQGDQDEKEDFDLESKLNDWQKRESKEYNITYEEYFSSQTPMARVELNKQGKILNMEVPINIKQKFEEILINFLEHYSPNLSRYHYKVHKYIDDNGDEIEEIIETGDEEDIDDVTSKAQLLENEVILGSAYKKTLLANTEEQTPNQKIVESKNSKAQKGQIENGSEEVDVKYFHTKENEQQGLKQIDVKFKVQLQLIDFNLIQEEELINIEEDFKLNHIISVNKEEYEYRKSQKLDEENQQYQYENGYQQQQDNHIENNDNDENRRILRQADDLFENKEFTIFDLDFLGFPFFAGKSFICKKNPSKPGFLKCTYTPYWVLLGWHQNLPNGEFDVDARSSSMTHPTVVFIDKNIINKAKKFNKKFPTPIGIPLFIELEFKIKVDFKVYATVKSPVILDLTAALTYDVILKAYAGADAGIIRVFLFGKFEIFQGVMKFNFLLELKTDSKEIHMKMLATVDVYPIKITEWSTEKPILGPYTETFWEYSFVLFDFNVIFNEDGSGQSDQSGDSSQRGQFKEGNQLIANDNNCRQIEIESAGFYDGEYAFIKVDNQSQTLEDNNGFHVMVFDFITLKQKFYRNFDTYNNQSQIIEMINFIKSLNNGDFVAIAVKSQQTTTVELWNILEQYLGLTQQFTWRASYAAFSQIKRQKGAYDFFLEKEGKQAKVNSRFCQYDSDWITVQPKQNTNNQNQYVVYLNEKEVGNFPQDNAIFVQVFDQKTLESKGQQTLNYLYLKGSGAEYNGRQLEYFIDRIEFGDIVVYGIFGNIPSFNNNAYLHNLLYGQLGLEETPVNNEKIINIARKGMIQGTALSNVKYLNMGNNAIAGSTQMMQLEKRNICKTFETYTKSDQYMGENQVIIDGVRINENYYQYPGISYWVYDRYTLEQKYFDQFDKHQIYDSSIAGKSLFQQKAGVGDIIIIATKWVHGQRYQDSDSWGYKEYLGFDEYMQKQYVYSSIAQNKFNTPLVDKYQVQYDLYHTIQTDSYVGLDEDLGVKARFCSITEPQNYFYVTSKGTYGDKSFTVIKDNSQLYQSTNSGLHIISFDKDSYLLKSSQIFDFSSFKSSNIIEQESIQLVYYLNQIPDGDLVAYGITGENQQLNQQSLQALENYLGYDSILYPVNKNDTIAAWSRKGYAKGQATILRKSSGKGISHIKASPDIEHIPSKSICKNIKVVSGGFESGDLIKLYEDGVEINVEQVNGVHVFVYDQYTMVRKYNTSFAWDQGQLIESFVDNVIEGDYVYIGVKDNHLNQMQNGGAEAFKKLGINHTYTFRESFAAIGQKGISKAVMDFYPKEKKLEAYVKGNMCSRDKTHFSVESRGNWDGKEFDVLKDGVSQLPTSNNSTNTTSIQGFNIAVFDQDTKNLTSFETFQNNASNASLLVDFVQNITYGDLVAYGIDENAQDLLTNDVQTKLEQNIGFDSYNYKVKKGDSLSGWGRKGLKQGEGLILKKSGTEGGANILGSTQIQSKEEEKVKCKNINIKSNGSINYLKFLSDGLTQTTYKDKHGIHFIVLDKYTLNKKNMTYFDTYTDSTQAEKMVEFIGNIEDGDIVLYGIHTDASQYMTTAGYNALKLIGMNQQLQLFDSLAGFGFKGQSHGVYEHNSQNIGLDLSKQYAQVNNQICGQKTHEALDFEHFTVISETFPDTDTVNESYFKVKNGNETLYETKNQTGMVVVIIDQKTRQVKQSRVIDVTTKQWELTDLVSFAQNGDYVAYGSAKNINLTSYGDKEHLQNLIGYDFDKNPFKIDYGFAAFARKGYTKGQAVVLDRDPISGKAIVSASPRIPINIPVDQTFCKSIFIESQGLNDGDNSNIYVNGQVINKASDDSNSIFLVVFDQYTLEKKFQHVFQTGSYNLAYQYMAQRIDSIQDGDYVALTVRGDAQQYMNTEGFTALSTLGINTQFGRNDSFAAFTRKGSLQPAIIDTFQSGQGKKAIVQGSFCSGQDKDSKLYSINFDNSNSSINYTLDVKYGDQSIKSYSSNISQLIFVVIDQDTNQVTQIQTYDNLHDLNQQYSAVTFLETLKKGDTVVYTMARDYSIMFGYELVNALEHLLGYVKETEVWADDSMIVMAKVGMSRGLAEMHVRKANKGPAIIFSSPNRNIPQFAQVCKNIQVSSSDFNHGNNLEFLINNQSISLSSNTQGIHIAVINKFTLEVKYKQVFNPSNQTELQNMGTFIDGINAGDYVLLGVKEDGSGIDQAVYDKIKNLGIDTQIGYRETFAAIGRKGISKGIFDLTVTNQNYKSIVKSNICAQDTNFIHVESKGKQTSQTTNANFFRVDHNGQLMYNSDLRGIHFVVFDQDNLQVKSKKVFNPHDRVEDNQSMQEYIQMIPLGDIVAYGVSDDGSQNLSTESIKALEDYLGLKLLSNLQYNDSMAGIGRKGMGKGQALVNHKGSQQNSAKVFQSYNI